MWLEKRSFIAAILIGCLYGVFLRLMLGGGSLAGSTYQVMTAGFLVFGPTAIGFLTISSAEKVHPCRVWQWVFLPWLPIVLSMLAAAAFDLEGWICIAMALPIALLFASAGGTAAGLLARRSRKPSAFISACVALLPFLIAPVETRMSAPVQHRQLKTQVFIQASPDRVWANIERVPRINASDLPTTWTQQIGFPRPLEATLSFEGVGGVRHATFEGGLLFIETITQWQPNRLLCFSIHADTAHIPPTTLDEHVTIGGRYFDVLNGRYEIQPLPSGGVLLHLSSEERLSTDFNLYAALWSDAVMRNIQESILSVIKHRCEVPDKVGVMIDRN